MDAFKQNFNRPASEEELQGIVDFAYGLAKQDDYANAIALCEWLMEEAETATAGRRERAAVLSHQGDIAGAIKDLEHVVAEKPPEPADLHALGMLQLQSGATTVAIDSFSQALAAGAVLGSTYYDSSSLLFRAEAKLRLGDHAGAAADAALLPDGYNTYISGRGIRTKEDIASEADAALARTGKAQVSVKN